MIAINLEFENLLRLVHGGKIGSDILVEINFSEFETQAFNYLQNEVKNCDEIAHIFTVCSGAKNGQEFLDDHFELLKKYPIQAIIPLVTSILCYYRNPEERTLQYLLSNYYKVYELNLEVYNEIKDFIECETISRFESELEFKSELQKFNDINYLQNNYINFKIPIDDFIELFNSNKIDSLEKLQVAIDILKWNLPEKYTFRNDRAQAILKVFESHSWSVDEINLWSDNFYAIDFEFDSYMLAKQVNDARIIKEAKHISEMNKRFPNYRHD